MAENQQVDKNQSPRVERLRNSLVGRRDRMLKLKFPQDNSKYEASLGPHKYIWHRALETSLAPATQSRMSTANAWVERTPVYDIHMRPFNHARGYNANNLLDEAPLASALDAIPEDDVEWLLAELRTSRIPRIRPLAEDDLRLNVYKRCADRLEPLFELLGLDDSKSNLYLEFVTDAYFKGPEESDIRAKTDAGWFLSFNDGKKARGIPLLAIELKNIQASVTAGGHFSQTPYLFRSEEEKRLLERKEAEIVGEVRQAYTPYAQAGAQLKIPYSVEEFYEAIHQSAAVAILHGGTVWAAGDPSGLFIVEESVLHGIQQQSFDFIKPVTLKDLHPREAAQRTDMSNTDKRLEDLNEDNNYFAKFLPGAARLPDPTENTSSGRATARKGRPWTWRQDFGRFQLVRSHSRLPLLPLPRAASNGVFCQWAIVIVQLYFSVPWTQCSQDCGTRTSKFMQTINKLRPTKQVPKLPKLPKLPTKEFDTVICLHNEDAGDIEYVITLVLFKVFAKNLPGIGKYWNKRRDAVRAYDEKRRGKTNEDEIEDLRNGLHEELNRIARDHPTFQQESVLRAHTRQARENFHQMWHLGMFQSAQHVSSRVGRSLMCNSDFKWLKPLQQFLCDNIKSSDVYKCSTPKLANGETIVLKLIHPDNSDAFITEVQALIRLNSVPRGQRYYWPKLDSWGTLYNEDMSGPKLGVHLYIALEHIKSRLAYGNQVDATGTHGQPTTKTATPPPDSYVRYGASSSRAVSTGSTLSAVSYGSANTVTTDETGITAPSVGVAEAASSYVDKFDSEEELNAEYDECYKKLFEQGIVHNDFRLANVVFTADTQGPLAKAIDFGRCKFLLADEGLEQSQGVESNDEEEEEEEEEEEDEDQID